MIYSQQRYTEILNFIPTLTLIKQYTIISVNKINKEEVVKKIILFVIAISLAVIAGAMKDHAIMINITPILYWVFLISAGI